MVITRTPFRVSFAGGGSDLEAFYSHRPGMVLSSTINKYMYMTVKERFGGTFRISYSQTEIAERIEEIRHPIVRECLSFMGVQEGLEIVSIADLPAGSGMGSSSCFTAALLLALHAMRGDLAAPRQLAEETCYIEIDRLGEPIGKQDQYIAAYGGLRGIEFQSDGDVFVAPVICSQATRVELNHRLMLFFTNRTRDARSVLRAQQENTADRLEQIAEMCRIAQEMKAVLQSGRNLNEFGKLLDHAWRLKKTLSTRISNSDIDDYYDRAMKAGAIGGKLLGAGSGGFLLFYCEPHRRAEVRRALADLPEVPFALEPEGSKVIYVENSGWRTVADIPAQLVTGGTAA